MSSASTPTKRARGAADASFHWSQCESPGIEGTELSDFSGKKPRRSLDPSSPIPEPPSPGLVVAFSPTRRQPPSSGLTPGVSLARSPARSMRRNATPVSRSSISGAALLVPFSPPGCGPKNSPAVPTPHRASSCGSSALLVQFSSPPPGTAPPSSPAFLAAVKRTASCPAAVAEPILTPEPSAEESTEAMEPPAGTERVAMDEIVESQHGALGGVPSAAGASSAMAAGSEAAADAIGASEGGPRADQTRRHSPETWLALAGPASAGNPEQEGVYDTLCAAGPPEQAVTSQIEIDIVRTFLGDDTDVDARRDALRRGASSRYCRQARPIHSRTHMPSQLGPCAHH